MSRTAETIVFALIAGVAAATLFWPVRRFADTPFWSLWEKTIVFTIAAILSAAATWRCVMPRRGRISIGRGAMAGFLAVYGGALLTIVAAVIVGLVHWFGTDDFWRVLLRVPLMLFWGPFFAVLITGIKTLPLALITGMLLAFASRRWRADEG